MCSLNIKSFISHVSLIQGPLSVDRFPEGDDDGDVDVEQCSDSEALNRTRTPRTTSNNSRTTPPSPSDEERLTPEPVSFSHFISIYSNELIIFFLHHRSSLTSTWNA